MFKLGNYVKTKTHGHEGIIYSKYHNFDHIKFLTMTGDEWLFLQEPKLHPSYIKIIKQKPWYRILCKDGGSVICNEDDLIKINKFDLNNDSFDFYFE